MIQTRIEEPPSLAGVAGREGTTAALRGEVGPTAAWRASSPEGAGKDAATARSIETAPAA
jgi:hypothetical protein